MGGKTTSDQIGVLWAKLVIDIHPNAGEATGDKHLVDQSRSSGHKFFVLAIYKDDNIVFSPGYRRALDNPWLLAQCDRI